MSLPKLKLYHYWRSSSSWRVRWALEHKSIPYETHAIDLLKNESESSEHLARNPMGFVPTLEITHSNGQRTTLSESLPIIEWLNELKPEPSLLPLDPLLRAKSRQLAEIINAGTQPLQNLGPQELYSSDSEKRKEWARHWMKLGLHAYETLARETAGSFSVGDSLSIADLCLIPQLYNARRYDLDLTPYATCLRVEAYALTTPACERSHPDRFKP